MFMWRRRMHSFLFCLSSGSVRGEQTQVLSCSHSAVCSCSQVPAFCCCAQAYVPSAGGSWRCCGNCWQWASLRRQLTALLREMWLSWRPLLYFLCTKSLSATDSWCIGSQNTTFDAKHLGERSAASYQGSASSRHQDIPCSDFYEKGLQVKDTGMVWLKICGKMLFSINPMLFLCQVQMLCSRSFLCLSK